MLNRATKKLKSIAKLSQIQIDAFLSWNLIRTITGMRLLRNSLIALIAIPFVFFFVSADPVLEVLQCDASANTSDRVCKFLFALQSVLTTGAVVRIFVGALIIALGLIFYHVRCPGIIRRFTNWTDFKQSTEKISDTFTLLIQNSGASVKKDNFVSVLSQYFKDIDKPLSDSESQLLLKENYLAKAQTLVGAKKPDPEHEEEGYVDVRAYANHLFPYSRFICSMLLMLGSVLVFWAYIQRFIDYIFSVVLGGGL